MPGEEIDMRAIIEDGRDMSIVKRVEEHDRRMDALEKTSTLVVEIHAALIGTLDKKGLITTIREHDEYICDAKKSRVDWVRWVERAVAATGFAWILAKLKGVHLCLML